MTIEPQGWRFRASVAIPALVTAFLGIGCERSLPPAASPEEARAALQTALDAWQKGNPVQELQSRVPPIYISDQDWSDGQRLTSYKIVEGSALSGQSWRCAVVLSLESKQGRKQQKKAHYSVDTQPACVITRNDL